MYPEIVPNLCEIISSAEHRKNTLWRIRLTKQLTVPIDLHYGGGDKTVDVNSYCQQYGYSYWFGTNPEYNNDSKYTLG